MTTEIAWAHLPNAPHIDRILTHLKKYPEKWDAAWDAARADVWDAAWGAARAAAWYAARDAAWYAARDAVWDAARDAARGAVYALIAWDDAAVMLTYSPPAVDTMANLGHPGAILLRPAVIAMYEEVTS